MPEMPDFYTIRKLFELYESIERTITLTMREVDNQFIVERKAGAGQIGKFKTKQEADDALAAWEGQFNSMRATLRLWFDEQWNALTKL